MGYSVFCSQKRKYTNIDNELKKTKLELVLTELKSVGGFIERV